MVDSQVLMVCGHCGNKENCQVRRKYTKHIETEYGDHYVTAWRILECPSCNGLILQQSYKDSEMPVDEEEITILYPVPKTRKHLTNLPKVIKKEYEETLKVKDSSIVAAAVLARRTLEAIFTQENAAGRTLEDKVNNLIHTDRIPPLVADLAHLGRKIGNLGAHFNKEEVTEEDISVMLDFLETILEYLYVLPAKVAEVKERLNMTP